MKTDRLTTAEIERDSCARCATNALLEGDMESAKWHAERYQKWVVESAAALAEFEAEVAKRREELTRDRG